MVIDSINKVDLLILYSKWGCLLLKKDGMTKITLMTFAGSSSFESTYEILNLLT